VLWLIDGIRKNIDRHYKFRFSPRKPSSIWSAVNIRNVERLVKDERMQPAGLRKRMKAPKKIGPALFLRTEKSGLVEPYLESSNEQRRWKFFSSAAASTVR